MLYTGGRFDDCFERHYKVLCYFALKYIEDAGKAEDIVQEVFIRLLDGNFKFTDEEHLKRWLYMSVKNACLNHIKLSGIHAGILKNVHSDDEWEIGDAFTNIVRSEVYAKILDAIEELPRECKKVFKLAYLDGIDNEEIAEVLNISVNTVKSQKNKAKIQLREKLKDLYPVAILLLHLV